VLRVNTAQSRFEVAVRTGLTPLVGREEELGVLRRRWEQAKAGDGQVVLLSGEPGLGKSRLAQTLKEQASAEGATRIEFRCSPYYQNSAFYPIIEHLQRLLQYTPHEVPEAKLAKLQRTLAAYRFPQAETVPLFAGLLSLPHPVEFPPLTLSPQKQRQKTQEALVAWIMEETEQHPVYYLWEDLHWADPSSLEVLGLLMEQMPAVRLLLLLTFRPEFSPPWASRSHVTPLVLSRLPHSQAAMMVERVTAGKSLPTEVLQQIVSKTDGVPLFIEELTRMVLESGLLREAPGRYELTGPLPPLAIPTRLHDSLMARLDRLAAVKEVAQLGATLGREFSYELLQAVAPGEEERLPRALAKLVDAGVLYQRGRPPEAQYLFKHVLLQEAAYQSMLKSTRQHYHQQIAQVLAARFSETVETEPELLARHYTEAGLIAQALPYWQQAGQRASQHSAYREAISHLTKGLELLKTLPDSPERVQQELRLLRALGPALMSLKGFAAPEVEQTYARACELGRQSGSPQQLLSVQQGLQVCYLVRGEVRKARDLAEQSLRLARRISTPTALMAGHAFLVDPLYYLGEFTAARQHLEQAWALYSAQDHHLQVSERWIEPRVGLLMYLALTSWLLGYPDQAQQRLHEGLARAERQSHLYSLAGAWLFACSLHCFQQEWQRAGERAEAVIRLATEQGYPYFVANGMAVRGRVLAEQGQVEEGIVQMQQGLATLRATGTELARLVHLLGLAAAYGRGGRIEEGLAVLAKAQAMVDHTGIRVYEVGLHETKGWLLLARAGDNQAQAEACFQQAINIARQQQAKSLELRAVVSLSRLWQQQGKQKEAHALLSEIYGWFTEGFDTKDLQEAKALLTELGEEV
jgi:predicted ATPase